MVGWNLRMWTICAFWFVGVSKRMGAAADQVQNAVSSEPAVQCSGNSMLVNFNTQNPFEGHVFVKGRYNEPGCRADATNNRTVSIKVPFNACGARKQRSTNPPGQYVTAVVVISFHPMFVTNIDRAYNVKCFFVEADNAVSANLEVSEMTTASITQNVPLPSCKYEVLTDNENGQPIRYAIVGQQVYHRWSCEGESVNVLCATVHTCFVDDGQNARVQLLDENGCAKDKFVMNNLNYTSDLAGGVESHLFKFPDKPGLFFQCQIRLSLKEGDKCQRTSDKCQSPTRGKRDADEHEVFLLQDDTMNQRKRGENVEVYSENINILEVDGDQSSQQEWNRVQIWNRNGSSTEDQNPERDERICISSAGFGILVASLVLILLVSLLVTAAFCLRSTKIKPNSAQQ